MDQHGKPLFSIILPAFNGERYIRKCISSVVSQTCADFELIIGNDGSTDTTQAILGEFHDPRIRIHDQRVNLGLFKNLNYLIKQARGQLIRILCQDDYLDPECLEVERVFFETNPEIGMSFCKAIIVDSNDHTLEFGALHDLPSVINPLSSLQLFLYYGCIPGNLSTVCLRRYCVEQSNPFDESFSVSGDYELWTRVCAHRALGVIHRHLVRLRAHGDQLSRSRPSGVKFVVENRRIRAALLSKMPPEIRSKVVHYAHRRQDVLDVHFCLHCLITGRLVDLLTAIRAIGAVAVIYGAVFWFLTLNNHVRRPKAGPIAGWDTPVTKPPVSVIIKPTMSNGDPKL